MKTLMVNKFLYPRGGAENYVFKLGEILENQGHQVEYFGCADSRNIVGNKANSYVSAMDLQKTTLRNVLKAFSTIYSIEARKKIRSVLHDFNPDVVHLNNIHFYLTPSIILEIHKFAKKQKKHICIVYTAHDYQLICPSHGLFDPDMSVCEKCLKGNYWPCFQTKCLKNSRMKSLLGVLEAYFWKWSKAYEYIDHIICPSQFLKDKLDTQKRFLEKTIFISNFVDEVEYEEVKKEDYVLEFGKLCRDKGTGTLLEVCKRMPDVHFVFAGYGPMEKDIQQLPNAEYVGFKTGKDLEQLIRCAKISVYPSEWYENCPFSVIESQMYHTPVIGSRMGGIPELIKEGETGELFEAGNARELEQKLRKLLENPMLCQQYTDNCKNLSFETPESYYRKIMKIYKRG